MPFPSVHIVGSLASKLPSIINYECSMRDLYQKQNMLLMVYPSHWVQDFCDSSCASLLRFCTIKACFWETPEIGYSNQDIFGTFKGHLEINKEIVFKRRDSWDRGCMQECLCPTMPWCWATLINHPLVYLAVGVDRPRCACSFSGPASPKNIKMHSDG